MRRRTRRRKWAQKPASSFTPVSFFLFTSFTKEEENVDDDDDDGDATRTKEHTHSYIYIP